jgi:type VI secretion system protein ImpE
MSSSSIATRLQHGDLAGALADATAAVKQSPADTATRGLLAELLCLNGEFERADTHFGLVATQDPGTAIGISLLRRLIRAEAARGDWYSAGRLPELLGDSQADLRPYIEAGVALRLGEAERAAALLIAAESHRTPRPGRCNDRAIDDFRDLDDGCGGFLEVFTGAGDYRWVPLDAIRAIQFEPPRRPRDLIWREADLELTSESRGTVFVPTVYRGLAADTDAYRLGQASEWLEPVAGLVRGKGQRCFLAGDEALGALELESVEFDG